MVIRVAQVADLLDETGGGIPPVVAGLCQSLASLETETLCLARGGEGISDLDGVKTQILPTNGPTGFGWMPHLVDVLTDWQPDVIHVHGIWTGHFQAATRVARKYNIPLVVSPHGMLEPWALQQGRVKKSLMRRLFVDRPLSSAHCLHALNHEEAQSIRDLNLGTNCAVIPNGMVLPRLPVAGSPQQTGLKKLLFLGRLHAKKGIIPLLNAWAEMRADLVGWELVVAGWDDGGHEAEINAAIDSLGLCDQVSLPGKVFGSEKEALYQAVDAFILPSFSEGLPMTVLEAWSYQLPVLMTDECHLQEGFDAEAAIKVSPSADSIVEGLKRLIALSDEQRIEVGVNGRRLVEERFTWDFVAGQMNEVYRWVSGRCSAPDSVVES